MVTDVCRFSELFHFCLNYMLHFKMLIISNIIGASLSEPHTDELRVAVVCGDIYILTLYIYIYIYIYIYMYVYISAAWGSDALVCLGTWCT